MATTRTTVEAIRRGVIDAYESGRAMGLSHEECVERARQLSAMPAATIREWVESLRRGGEKS